MYPSIPSFWLIFQKEGKTVSQIHIFYLASGRIVVNLVLKIMFRNLGREGKVGTTRSPVGLNKSVARGRGSA